MKNVNYNLIKMLHAALDDAWRVEKHYLRDARGAKCKECEALMKKLWKNAQEAAGNLQKEMSRHMKASKGKLR
ncbi:hypothetical protein HYT45_03765 [Candidatus Uhrbacteria bacterium]|nr:hypothetical protein [Candidatus Uhrbacteria bacterium]